jgi:hypothetical protein
VNRKRCGSWLGAALAVVLMTQDASAQAPPGGGMGMPTREQIRERVLAVLAASPEETITVEGVCRITYKKVITDPQRVAQALGQQMGGQIPAGVDIDQYIRAYTPQITEMLNEFLADFGKFEALVDLKVKSKRIPRGEYRIGLVFEGERPLALMVSGGELRRPVDIRLKTRGVDMCPEVKLEFKLPNNMVAGQEKFELQLDFMRFQARSKAKIERADAAGGDAPAEEPEEEEREPATPPAGGGH